MNAVRLSRIKLLSGSVSSLCFYVIITVKRSIYSPRYLFRCDCSAAGRVWDVTLPSPPEPIPRPDMAVANRLLPMRKPSGRCRMPLSPNGGGPWRSHHPVITDAPSVACFEAGMALAGMAHRPRKALVMGSPSWAWPSAAAVGAAEAADMDMSKVTCKDVAAMEPAKVGMRKAPLAALRPSPRSGTSNPVKRGPHARSRSRCHIVVAGQRDDAIATWKGRGASTP